MKINITQPVFDSAAQAAAVALQQDAQTTRQDVRMRRQSAQQREIDHLKQAAAKLHDMADMALASGVLQGVTGTLGAACQIRGAYMQDRAGVGLLQGGKSALEMLGRVDPFQISKQRDQAERADCETDAKAASFDAQDAGDIEQEARRRSQKADDLRQQLMRIEHETRKASLGC